MKNKELTKEQQSLILIAQTLDHALEKGAFNRGQVLDYNEALNVLNNLINGERN
tara:strand:- start:4 stop:165 length:162 start_codon:yes stop_codon:yes gene_type:complete